MYYLYIGNCLTKSMNRLLYWDRGDKLTSYSATEGIKGLVIVGKHDKCTGLASTGGNWF